MYNEKYGDIDLPDKVNAAAALIASQLGGMDYDALDALRAKLNLEEGVNHLMSNGGLLHLVIGATKTHGITAILDFKGVAAVPLNELMEARDASEPADLPETSEADGIAAIVGLQKAGGKVETEEQAKAGWAAMDDGEKLSTIQLWNILKQVTDTTKPKAEDDEPGDGGDGAPEDGPMPDLEGRRTLDDVPLNRPGMLDTTDGM